MTSPNLAVVTDDLLREITDVVVRAADPERVILFGSRARASAGPESDIDLLVIEAQPFGPSRSRMAEVARLSRLLKRFRVALDLLVFSQDEIDRWAGSSHHVIARALREGRVLHERS
jgi:predicted nucleotidyltransferase